MAPDRCWSSIVVGPADSALFGLRPGGSSLVGCDLSDGHSGLHSSDGGRGGTARRTWVMWGDYARGPQPGRMLDPCHGTPAAGGACTLYEGHGGVHRYLAAPVTSPDPLTYSANPPSFPIPAARAPAPPIAPTPPPWPAPAVDSAYPFRGRHGLAGAPSRSAPLSSPPTAPAVSAPSTPPVVSPRAAPEPARRTVAPDPPPVPPAPARQAPVPVAEPPESEETVTDKSRSSKHGKQKPSKHGKGKHKGKTDDFQAPSPPASSGPEVHVSDLRDLGSLLQVNDYADRSRTSFIEVIEPDGTSRTVVAPVSAEPQSRTPVEDSAAGSAGAVHRHARVADSAPGSDERFAELSKMKITTVAASTAAASQAVESVSAAVHALPEEQLLVRRQVGEALRDVAAALAKLAESLDPR